MKKLTIFAAAVALLSATTVSCSKSSSENAESQADSTATIQTAEAPQAQGVIDLKDDAKFRPDQKVDQITVLDFNATWCIPCKKLTPAYHQVADSLKDVAFYSVDIDSLPETKAAFNVENVPTVIILSPNGEPKRFNSLAEFKNAVDGITGTSLTDTIAANLIKYINEAKK